MKRCHQLANHRRRGQAMIEFALIFGLLLMLIVGIFEMGRAIWSFTTLSYASRQAARYAIVNSELGDPDASLSPDPIDEIVKGNAIGLDPNLLTITKSWNPDNQRGSQFEITVSYPVDLVASPLFLGDTKSITVSATSRLTVMN